MDKVVMNKMVGYG